MTLAITCTAVLAGLLFLLGANVSRLRGAASDQAPQELDDPLYVAIRAHGNTAEYAPMLGLLMLLVGSRDPADWMLVAFVVATAARIIHAIGVLGAADMAKPTPLRMVGALGTYAAGLALVAAALVVR